jgi:trans-aconitate methyltransferase
VSTSHWDRVYGGRAATEVSWHQAHPTMSIRMIQALDPSPDDPVIDIGGGVSRLTGELLTRGFRDLTVLDLSPAALKEARGLLGDDAERVRWIEHDLLTWPADRRYGLWHDRAVFHFLVDAEQRARYRAVLRSALWPGGGIVVATFAPDGPESCSGLPVARYDTEELVAAIGGGLVVATEQEEHRTPAGVIQPFTWVALRL